MTGFSALPQHEVRLGDTTIRYRDLGAGESTIVFVHGLFTNGTLWRNVVPLLTDRFRCLVPDWPLGAHTTAIGPNADASPRGIARMIAEFLERLDLRDVTLVANDTGGAITQLLVVDHPDSIARLVLTPCDAFENFLPAMFRPLQYAAKLPLTLTAAFQLLRLRPLRRVPMAFGWLSRHPVPPEISDGWLRPFLTDRAIRRDTVRFLRAIDSRDTLDAATRLASFSRPVLLAWATQDRVFPFEHAQRLASLFPHATVEPIPDSYAFVPEDQPQRLAELLQAFAEAPKT
jgi:pimeloyl-ACP methyl ester carboxylesterase